MAYFADLSPYTYGFKTPTDSLLNVGWLSKLHQYRRGPVPAEFLLELRRLVQSPTELHRGSHRCEFCPSEHFDTKEEYLEMLARHRKDGGSGSGEIRIRAIDGITYAAPALIAHYVSAHEYQPPQVFIDAVLLLHGSAGVA